MSQAVKQQSYHMDTNPINHKATPGPAVYNLCSNTSFILSDLTKHEFHEGVWVK